MEYSTDSLDVIISSHSPTLLDSNQMPEVYPCLLCQRLPSVKPAGAQFGD